jgi:hypothetical protein
MLKPVAVVVTDRPGHARAGGDHEKADCCAHQGLLVRPQVELG